MTVKTDNVVLGGNLDRRYHGGYAWWSPEAKAAKAEQYLEFKEDRESFPLTKEGQKSGVYFLLDDSDYLRDGEVYITRHRIKIGHSVDIGKRRRTLQGESGLYLTTIGFLDVAGTEEDRLKKEQNLHELFSASRIHPRREWFHSNLSLLQFIKEECTKYHPWVNAQIKRMSTPQVVI
jgi:hypothetical protein